MNNKDLREQQFLIACTYVYGVMGPTTVHTPLTDMKTIREYVKEEVAEDNFKVLLATDAVYISDDESMGVA